MHVKATFTISFVGTIQKNSLVPMEVFDTAGFGNSHENDQHIFVQHGKSVYR